MTIIRMPGRTRLAMGLSGVLCAALALVASSGTAAPAGTVGTADAAPNLSDLVNRQIGLHQSELVWIDVDPAPADAKQTVIELDGQIVTVAMKRHSVRSDDFRVYVDRGGDELIEIDPGPVRTYRGAIEGDEGSVATGSVTESGLSARIKTGDGRVYWVEPVAPHVADVLDPEIALAVDGFHVVYTGEDVIDTGMECGTPSRNLADDFAARSEGDGPANPGGENYVAEIGIDVDNRYLLFYPLPTAQTRIEEIFVGVNSIYETDVDITHTITAFIFREVETYTSGTIDGLLAEFRSRWLSQHGNIVRDVAELFTGRNLSGGVAGIAYLNGICNTNGYNVVENRIPLEERVHLSTHELGHNWAADHCNCSGFIMNASFPPTSTMFHPTFTIPAMVNYRNSRNCLDDPPPPPPANDNCGSAIPIGDGLVATDTSGATDDGPALPGSCDEGGGLDFSQDIWFDYTAPCTGEVEASLCISGTYDNRIAIYAGQSCTGTLLACSDDACGAGGVQALAFFNASAGQHYRVRVGGNNDSGTGILRMTCTPGPDCPEDLDGSGSVDFGDINTILAAWGNAGGPEDLDNSGFVDFGDLLLILAAWGPC